MPTVLLIDDDGFGLSVRAYLFKTTGYNTLSAYTGMAGLELFKANVIDLVVLDLGLPDISGAVVLKAIREIDTVVPVIVLSGIVNIPAEVVCMASSCIIKGEGAQRLLDESAKHTGSVV